MIQGTVTGLGAAAVSAFVFPPSLLTTVPLLIASAAAGRTALHSEPSACPAAADRWPIVHTTSKCRISRSRSSHRVGQVQPESRCLQRSDKNGRWVPAQERNLPRRVAEISQWALRRPDRSGQNTRENLNHIQGAPWVSLWGDKTRHCGKTAWRIGSDSGCPKESQVTPKCTSLRWYDSSYIYLMEDYQTFIYHWNHGKLVCLPVWMSDNEVKSSKHMPAFLLPSTTWISSLSFTIQVDRLLPRSSPLPRHYKIPFPFSHRFYLSTFNMIRWRCRGPKASGRAGRANLGRHLGPAIRANCWCSISASSYYSPCISTT